jgi:hypothetical protein
MSARRRHTVPEKTKRRAHAAEGTRLRRAIKKVPEPDRSGLLREKHCGNFAIVYRDRRSTLEGEAVEDIHYFKRDWTHLFGGHLACL